MTDAVSDNAAVLVINAGSSSIKFALYGATTHPTRQDLQCTGAVTGFGHPVRFETKDAGGARLTAQTLPQDTDHEAALAILLKWIDDNFANTTVVAVGHRVALSGTYYKGPVLLDGNVVAKLATLNPLAPLHQPHHIAAITALARLHPALPQVACFDTSFHHTQPKIASLFALPRALFDEGVRRYGFHGLSYEYITSVLPDFLGAEASRGRIVICHLGSGDSMCAIADGRSVATTTGFTGLDGLPMSRRCGNLDPGVVLYLLQQKRLDADAISHLLYNESGLLGLSGISDDMRELLASSDPRAAEAIDVFVYRIRRELGALVACLGGLDAIVFTAGIGENAAAIRRRVCDDARWLGVEIDPVANDAGGPRITAPSSRVSGWVIPTDEDLVIGQHTWSLLNAAKMSSRPAPLDMRQRDAALRP
jgi:acetate kinase